MPLLLALILLAAPAAGPANARGYEALRARATAQYRAKRYAEACKGFQDASKLEPSDGANWADLGLCLAKLGQRDEAVAAERKAAQSGDVTTRLHAYFNLSKLGAARPLPANVLGGLQGKFADGGVPDAGSWKAAPGLPLAERKVSDGECGTWSADIPAGATLFVCPYERSSGGTGGTSKESGVALCSTLAAAKAFDPYAASSACMHVPLVEVEQSFCRPGDIGGAKCGACGCETAADPSACEERVAKCQAHATDKTARTCSVAFVDATDGRVGAVCSKRDEDGEWGPPGAKEFGR